MTGHQHDDMQAAIDTILHALSRAEERIGELEKEHAADIYRLWNHVSNMPGGI